MGKVMLATDGNFQGNPTDVTQLGGPNGTITTYHRYDTLGNIVSSLYDIQRVEPPKSEFKIPPRNGPFSSIARAISFAGSISFALAALTGVYI